MNRRKKSSGFWNPPPLGSALPPDALKPDAVSSATECTGLVRAVPECEGEAKSISRICGIHTVQPRHSR